MKKITAIEIAILFVAGLVPLLWLREGHIISNGDNFPLFLNSEKTFSSATNMWSPDYFGYANPTPSYLIYLYSGAFLNYLGLSVGSIQVLFQVLLFMGAGFSMFYFSRTIYPDHKLAPFFAGFFYMFNLFVLDSRFNLGFAWTYTFLPLILALFVTIVNAAYRQDRKTANGGIICFALVSVMALSVASVNPANIALFLFALSVLGLYFLFKYRTRIWPFILTVAKIIAVTVPINLWWLLPMLNTFIFSPAMLNSQVSVEAWSWTHARSSFLNLFWLNGIWGWLPEYVPYISFYSNPIVAVLMFVPFIVAASALLFKTGKSHFNAYVMICILFFVFLAKGVHDPFGQLNLLLYQYIPLMSMFREPASKFTLLIIPFLALLIGFAIENIAKIKQNIKPFKLKLSKILIFFLIAAFLISVFPLFTNPVETKTKELPFSSYVQIPQYWYQATGWINNQPGDWKVLLTPLNDFYQMPYTWGYYGSDQLLERFFEKPIVSTAALNGYVTNPNTSATLIQIRASVKFNRTDEFKALLDLLSIKYIVQRNDVQSDMIGRNLKIPSEMQAFFADQPYLKLVKSFGELDIYEYTEAKPSLYALLPSALQKTDVHIDTYTNLDKTWNFSFQDAVEDWKNSTVSNQSQATCLISQKNAYLEADMWNLTSGWITVDSPLMRADNESSYLIRATVSAKNDSQINVKIAEYSENMTLLTNSSMAEIDDGNLNSYGITCSFEPENENTKFFRIQFWNHFKANETSLTSLMLDNVRVLGSVSTLNMTGLQYLYGDMLENNNAEVLQVQNINPQKIIATVNTTQPFILATSETLDRFWVAYVNGQQVQSMSIYLGLKGFMINTTGQFDVTLEYQPQLWFNYSLTISGATALFLCVGLLYLNRTMIKGVYKNKIKKLGKV